MIKDTLEGDETQSPVLDVDQFEFVAEVLEKFGTYMHHATGMADSDHAWMEGKNVGLTNQAKQTKVGTRARAGRQPLRTVEEDDYDDPDDGDQQLMRDFNDEDPEIERKYIDDGFEDEKQEDEKQDFDD